mmetsp:Transcript_13291/g.29304  ORF Transcript_13291/g.29304 Transcript_13291/m.29304 type:complete len:389 (-) Transcript_13291:169-1335(-)
MGKNSNKKRKQKEAASRKQDTTADAETEVENKVETNVDDAAKVESASDDEGKGEVAAEADPETDADSDSDDEIAERKVTLPTPAATGPGAGNFVSDGRYRNKCRLLTLSSRGASPAQRHLLADLRILLPHSRKEQKLDLGRRGSSGSLADALREIAEIRRCDAVMYLEGRKRGRDGYLHLGVLPNGPSIKFGLLNVHTMDQLKMTGNCLQGSRPLLSFDPAFGDAAGHGGRPPQEPFLGLVRSMFVRIFGTPRGHPKSKPFVDRVMAFYYADSKIWVRNYQISQEAVTDAKEARSEALLRPYAEAGSKTSLVEIGPRFVLDPIRIFGGVFAGPTLYKNSKYVGPNEQRADMKRVKGDRFVRRQEAREGKRLRREATVMPEDPLGDVFR